MPTAAGCSPSGSGSTGRSSTIRLIFWKHRLSRSSLRSTSTASCEPSALARRPSRPTSSTRRSLTIAQPGAPKSTGPPDPASLRRNAEAKPDAARLAGSRRRSHNLGRRRSDATRRSTLIPVPWRLIRRTRTPCSGSGSPTGCATSPRVEGPATSRPPSMPGAAPSRSTRISTSGGVASNNTARASPNHTRSTTGSCRRGQRSPAAESRLSPSHSSHTVRSSQARSATCWLSAAAPVEPDPKGQIHRDEQRLIEAEVVVVPSRVRPGTAARVHVTFRPERGPLSDIGTTSPPHSVSGSPVPQAGRPRPECLRRHSPPSPSRSRFAASTSRSRHPLCDRKNPPRSIRAVQHLRAGRRPLPLPPSGLDD